MRETFRTHSLAQSFSGILCCCLSRSANQAQFPPVFLWVLSSWQLVGRISATTSAGHKVALRLSSSCRHLERAFECADVAAVYFIPKKARTLPELRNVGVCCQQQRKEQGKMYETRRGPAKVIE